MIWNWLRQHPQALPFLVLAIGFGLTALVSGQLWRLANAADDARSMRQAGQVRGAIVDRMNNQIALLYGASGLFAATGTPTADQFAAWVDVIDLPKRYPGVLGIGYTARLPAADDSAATAQVASGRATEPRQRAPENHAVVYLEPLDIRNKAAIGFNMFSEPTRRTAMERARDTGDAVASGRVSLVQEIDAEKQPGFLIYVPIYSGVQTPASAEERKAKLRGFVFSPFRAEDLFSGIVQHGRAPNVDVQIFDGKPDPSNLLYDSSPGPNVDAPHTIIGLEVADREWTIASRGAVTGDVTRGTLVQMSALIGMLATLICAGITWTQVRTRLSLERTIDERDRSEFHRDALLQELNHRVKNTLATVQSIARQTLAGKAEPAVSASKLEGRLRSLAVTHDALTATHWEGASLRQVLANELAAFGGVEGSRIEIAGPEVQLSPRGALSLGMTFHELATNAAKYGALSNDAGRIHVGWEVAANDGRDHLTIAWRESGGPAVTPPQRRGFGSTLIARGPAHELHAEVSHGFPKSGVECVIRIPVGSAVHPLNRA